MITISLSGTSNAVVSISIVALHWARLVLGWVNHRQAGKPSTLAVMYLATQLNLAWPSLHRWHSRCKRKLGSKQAHHVMHQPLISGLVVWAGVWLRAKEMEINTSL